MNPAPPQMHYVYLLNSDKKKWSYVGCTSNLDRRLNEHNNGKNNSTKKYLPVRLVYYEAFFSKSDAYQREKRLKQYGSSLQMLKTRLKGSLGEAG